MLQILCCGDTGEFIFSYCPASFESSCALISVQMEVGVCLSKYAVGTILVPKKLPENVMNVLLDFYVFFVTHLLPKHTEDLPTHRKQGKVKFCSWIENQIKLEED